MSRIAVACSLLLAVGSSLASAQGFARAPQSAGAPIPSEDLMPPVLDRAAVRAKLVERRAQNLERFRAYVKAGVFPSNVYKSGELNVWRDQDGHYCAAATIIRMSGATALVERVADQNNFIKLADVKQGPVMDWILMSGFTQDEVALIQRPFVGVSKDPVEQPTAPVPVDARLRAAETARLNALYKQIDATLVRNASANIDKAVDRLMKRPDLVSSLGYL